MVISIIIRCKDEEESIGRALEKIFAQETDLAYEVIVIDSGSTDRTVERAREFDVKVFQIPAASFTFGYALNYGIEEAKGSIIVNLSAHCFPLNAFWLTELVTPVIKGQAHATFGRQVPVKGLNPFEELSFTKHYPDEEKKSGRVPFSNANCAFLRSMWERLKFDEEIPSWEDYLWYALLKDAYTFLYYPKAAVYHTHPFSLMAGARRSYNDGMAFRIFKEKYGIDLIDETYPTATAKLKLFLEDFMRHVKFFVREGYVKEIFLIPVVRSLVFLAYQNGYKSLK